MTSKFLLSDNDLMIILHVNQDEIFEMISHGMPHYYCNNHFYFNWKETMDWITDTVELGYISEQSQAVTDYLRSILHEELDMDDLRAQLKEYIKEHRGLSDYRLVWLYNNCGGDKFSLFCKYMNVCFPRVRIKDMFKYYLALLKTLMDTGEFNDKINHHYEDDRLTQ